jgi:hypothetical protein
MSGCIITTLPLYRSMLDQLQKFKTDFDKKEGEATRLLAETDPKNPPAVAVGYNFYMSTDGIDSFISRVINSGRSVL